MQFPLDADQAKHTESLGALLQAYPRPMVEIKMKETVMLVVRSLVAQGKAAEAMEFIKTPTDILRYRALRLGEYARREGMERLKELLALKAEAQGLALVATAAEADEANTYDWALNPADVAGILL